jgi:hypothetical protein
MREAIAVALTICLAASAIPVAAQDRIVTTGGPIARAAMREAARLGTAEQVTPSAAADWARVRNLAPGTEIVVAVTGSPAGVRYVIVATDSDLTVLNATEQAVPPAARSVLRDVASEHPEYFAAAQQGSSFMLDNNVRLGPDGVFVANRKVADLGQVVERIVRSEVREIRSSMRPRGSVIGAVGGAAGGLLLGYLAAVNLAYKQCGDSCTDEKVLIGLSLVGLPVAGGVVGYTAFRRQTSETVYRAP